MKGNRQKIFDKYGGRCAYCGCELQKGWHVDEIEPVRRSWKYKRKENGSIIHGENFEPIKERFMLHPERLHLDNQNPACASCNINKHSDGLEEFRKMIAHFITTLNRDNTQYKIAKRYGLITETGIDVKFYFEKLNTDQPSQESDRDNKQEGLREEIERLEGLIKKLVWDDAYNCATKLPPHWTQEKATENANYVWEQFKTENNLGSDRDKEEVK